MVRERDWGKTLGSVLVTGGAGFIGHHLVREMVRRGVDLKVVDDLSTGRADRIRPFRYAFEFIKGSIVDSSICDVACRDVDTIFHLAAIPSVHRSIEQPLAAHEANASGTLNVLEAARRAGVRRLVYAGSSSAYGDTPELPKREDMSSRPLSPYAASKLAGEHYCQIYSELFDVETVVLRYFNVFGPGQDPKSEYSAVIPKFIRFALDEKRPTIYGDGEQTRDFTYVANVVLSNCLAATAPVELVNGKVFNVGCGRGVTVNTLWEEIRRLTGAWVEAVHGPPRSGEVRDSLADISAICTAMEFEPRIDLEEGLKRTVNWFRQVPEQVTEVA